MLQFIIANGPDSLRFGKVKGHAKQKHINAGECTQEEAHGNKIADSVADAGLKLHADGTIDIASWCAARHEKYVELMRKIHIIILQRFFVEKERREEAKNAANPFHKHDKPKKMQLQYGCETTAKKIRIRPMPTGVHKYDKQAATLDQIRDFISYFTWSIPAPGTAGITWLELLAAFEIFGHEVEMDPKDKARRKIASPNKSLKNKA